MQFTTTLTTLFLALSMVSANPAPAPVGVGLTHCNADGCLRALLPTRDAARFTSGALFCASVLANPNVGTSVGGVPTKAQSACGSNPTKISSACHCIPPAPTPTVTLS